MNDLYMLANSNKEMQIKGDKQLINLISSVKCLSSSSRGKEKKKMI